MSPLSRAEDLAVRELLAAVVLEAWKKADRVAALLSEIRGKPTDSPVEAPQLPAQRDAPSGPAIDFLLDLGSLLRVFDWERSELTDSLPEGLPTGNQIRGRMRSAFSADGYGGTDINALQLNAWLACFAWSSQDELGEDVILQDSLTNSDEVIEQLAEFLWLNRHRMLGD